MLRGLALGAALLALPACLRPSLVECGDLACAPSQVCHADRCVEPSRIDACEDVAEGTRCSVASEPGRCIRGVCEIATCGDGYIDEVLREECDDSVPDAHCVDFGYDIGRPACTACQPDETIGCTRFGWDRVIDAPTTNLSVDGDTLAYLTTSGLTVHTPSSTLAVPGVFSGVHASGGKVIAYHTTAFVEVTGGSPTAKQLPKIEQARLAPGGTVYALDDCVVSKLDGTRLEPIGPRAIATGFCAHLEIAPANGPHVFVSAGPVIANRVYRWDAMRGQFFAAAISGDPITDMRYHGDRLWVATTTGAYTIEDNDRRTDIALGFGPASIAFSGDAAFFSDNSGTTARVRGDRIQRFRAPGLVTGDGTLYSYRGPIYRFSGTQYGSRLALSSQLEVVASLQEPDGSVIVATKRALHRPSPDGSSWSQAINPSQITRAFAGGTEKYFVSDFTNEPGARAPALYSGSPEGTWVPVTVPMDPLIYAMWWAPEDETLFAVGDNDAGDAFLGVRRGNMWETAYRTGCTVRGVHGTDASHVIAVGGCGDRSVVWTYDGTQWTELERLDLAPPLVAALRLADGTLFVAGSGGGARFDGTTWTVDPGAVGSWLSGTSNSDVWLSGTFTSVQHFDGAVWSKLAVQASGPIAVTAAPDRVLFPGATEGFVELVR